MPGIINASNSNPLKAPRSCSIVAGPPLRSQSASQPVSHSIQQLEWRREQLPWMTLRILLGVLPLATSASSSSMHEVYILLAFI